MVVECLGCVCFKSVHSSKKPCASGSHRGVSCVKQGAIAMFGHVWYNIPILRKWSPLFWVTGRTWLDDRRWIYNLVLFLRSEWGMRIQIYVRLKIMCLCWHQLSLPDFKTKWTTFFNEMNTSPQGDLSWLLFLPESPELFLFSTTVSSPWGFWYKYSLLSFWGLDI